MSRILTAALAGTTAIGMMAGSFTPAQAAPLAAVTSAQIAGQAGHVEEVRYRGGYYGGGYGRGYGRRGVGVGGALAAGAALGIIGGALAASAAPRYGYYDYGYARPAYGYGYARPAYGYGYARPVYGYGYPSHGYGYYGY
ncbi:MAG: hypothetical protein K2Y56_02985 [Methylobacterium sp.]|uniref:hypothetical protein n=1 Tax=Methylobacterium sp. TaxID=409 RepID=UPI0025F4E2B0|nr:hypothetical protein [Methylobacterium sp.]MBX9930496.1 hypothetical protein [Methylobacterium sp.]